MRPLPAEWFARDATVVARELLGMHWRVGDELLRIVETEAYTQDDPASHSFRGQTARNAAMFGEPGVLYVYLIYGIHHCANVVTGAVGDGQAVLVRGVDGCSGPGRLCRRLGIDRTWTGCRFEAFESASAHDRDVLVTPRIGITKAVDWPRRYVLATPPGAAGAQPGSGSQCTQ